MDFTAPVDLLSVLPNSTQLKFILNKKAVLSQRWPRDAPSISRSWQFEIIQDGGGRHLEFVRIEDSAIISAVPENPTL